MQCEITFNLRKIRISKSLTQIQLARLAGLSQSHISELENLEKSPTLHTIQKLANALKVHPYELQKVEF